MYVWNWARSFDFATLRYFALRLVRPSVGQDEVQSAYSAARPLAPSQRTSVEHGDAAEDLLPLR